MAEPVKFTFDRAFDGGAKNRQDEVVAKLRADAAEDKAHAVQDAANAARAQALSEIEAATLAALERVEQGIKALQAGKDALETALRADMTGLAYTIARQLAGAALQQFPTAEIEKLIVETLSLAAQEPRIVIRLSSDSLAMIENHIEDMKKRADFAGAVVLIDEPGFAAGDIRVEWPNGGSERIGSDIMEKIEALVSGYIEELAEGNSASHSGAQE